MNIAPHTLVRDIAVTWPATIPALERLGIDFCCGGGVTLDQACQTRSLATTSVLAELQTLSDRDATGTTDTWQTAPLPDLVAHIVSGYHEPLRRDLALIDRLLEKVLARHGTHHPDMLPVLRTLFDRLSDDLLDHTRDEEAVFFPHVLRLVEGRRSPTLDVRTMLPQLTREHLKAGLLLKDLRALTHDYAPPEGSCVSFRALFASLEDLERSLHRHVHLENHVLFPRAAALEAAPACSR
jgi:regulator of cell morphogenesis and NO signaling